MTELPQTSPWPPLIFMPAQSSRSSEPEPVTLPVPTATTVPATAPSQKPEADSSETISEESKRPHKKLTFPLPKLRLEIRDLEHAGAEDFLSSVVASKALSKAVEDVLTLLYRTPRYPTTTVPSTRSVTLVLRPMEGVAYTTGTELDSDHKEIHFSLDYIHGIPASRLSEEIAGVLTHEMVHCYQYDAFGTCPGGLIEGIADWVRLNAHLSPPHWRKEASGKWDAGYQHTGYFLQYLEKRFGEGTVRRLNESLRIEKYDEKKFWTGLCGAPVKQLWSDYRDVLKKEERKAEEEECVLVEKADAQEGEESSTVTDGVD